MSDSTVPSTKDRLDGPRPDGSNLLTLPVDDTGSGSVSDSVFDPGGDPAKPANVPDKFWDADRGEVRLDALLASYAALERKLSQGFCGPLQEADRQKMLKALGVPDTPDGYQVAVPNDLFPVDPDLNARLHGCGFTPEQVQEVYNLAAEKMVPLILDLAAEFQAEHEVERLVTAFGGPEKWREVSRQLLDYGRKTLPPKILEGMACSYEGVMALYHLMKGDVAIPVVKGAALVSGLSEADLRSMMQNPKYWREKDPAYIAKVASGFEALYAS